MNNFKKVTQLKMLTLKNQQKNQKMKSPNWFDKNRFKKILAIIDSNKFSHKNKIGEFKYIDIKDLVNNTRNSTISEISAKKGLNTLNEIRNAEIIKHKKYTPKQKELLNLFDNLLDVILTDETLMSSKYENENENENDKPLINTTNKKENQIIVNNINKN